MRRREQFIFDEARRVVRGRFFELKEAGRKHPPLHNLCGYDEYDFRPDGRRRSEREQTNLLLRLYQEKLAELRERRADQQQAEERRQAGPEVQDAMQGWLDHVSEFRSPRTVKEYAGTCQKYVEAAGNHPVREFRRFHESGFLKLLKQEGLAEHSQAKHLRQLQAFWRWAYDQEYTDRPVRISKVRPTQREPSVCSVDDLERMERHLNERLETARPDRQLAVCNQLRAFWCLKETGMRGAEVLSLKLENILLSEGRIRIRDNPETDFHVKGRREESVPISSRLHDFLETDLSRRSEGEQYFCDNGCGRPQWATVDNMGQSFKRMQTRLGIDQGIKPLHGFRAYVTTQLLQHGVDISMARDILRHRDLNTTIGYLNRSKMPYRDAVNRLPTP